MFYNGEKMCEIKGEYMVSVLQENQETVTKSHFSALYEWMLQEQDDENAFKIMELYEKYLNNEFVLCFSGHFSAGKSSIINELLNRDILPKSPIPTSANIVKITSGDGVAKVYFKEDDPVQYKEPYNIDRIKDYCMDRDTIRQIEINTSDQILPPNRAIFDTPGIDAADEADRLMTESAMHLIDQLYYVMDYNHVQSEVNLYFLQEMQKQSVPIYIVINQVDKHQEAEISFYDYDKRVKQTFDQWGIKPNKIYYTSILDTDHPQNQLVYLKEDIFEQLTKLQDIQPNLIHSVESVLRAHQSFLKNKYEESFVSEHTTLDEKEIEHVENLEQQLTSIQKENMAFEQAFNEEIQSTLKNAYLMPRNVRDLAESFLYAQEKDFKIGFFQSKKKTAEEEKRRLNTFEDALTETMENTIQWKLREKIISLLQTYGIGKESLLEKVTNFQVSLNADDLYAYLKSGAKVNGNYVLQYTNEISAGIKSKYRSELSKLWDIIEKRAQEIFNNKETELKEELKPYKEQLQHLKENEVIQEELEDKLLALNKHWELPTLSETGLHLLDQAISQKQQLRDEELPEVVNESSQSEEAATISETSTDQHVEYNVSEIIAAIDGVVDEAASMKGFQTVIKELKQKKDRLENRELTIALFGTFSAGKSSFSNALFGEKVLPVSPNPTTAVINRISPVTNEFSHGTVNISIKSDTELISDLEMITKHLTKQSMNLEEWINWIKKDRIHEHTALSKTYQAYLEAVINGYESQKNELGEKITIGLDAFASYVTDETIACFIKEVDLYYDCALTRKGITLVDTPGADSVNARHTNVAFDYIKEADAILYVTYYNHAITKGDRDFLIQLGRVKESFEMDKMFFIVNASDLAESQDDLKLVVDYVSDQLLQFGIRNPRIFPVSSKQSLEEKLANNTLNQEMQHFEESFYRFIDDDLIKLTAESSVWDMNRILTMLESFIHSQELNEADRKSKINELMKQRKQAVSAIDQTNMSVFEERFIHRIDRQLHFVLERLYIEFHDMFTEFFNPSTINTTGKQAQNQLAINRNQFVDYVGYELLQEVRAVSLRIEAYMRDLLKEAYALNQEEAKKFNDSFVFPSQPEITFSTPAYEQAFENIEMDKFQKALKLYKNMKSFFEQNERENMKEAFYEILKPETKDYLNECNEKMKSDYKLAWQAHVDNMKYTAKKEITLIAEEHISVLESTVDIEQLQKAQKHIKETINSIA